MTAADPSRYRVVQARPHLSVDVHKKLSHLLLRSECLTRLARFKRRYGSLAVFLYVSSIPVAITALFSAANTAQVLSIVVLTLQLPLVMLAVLWLRPAMLRVLLSTYDFWFFSIINISTLLLILSFRDARTLIVVFMWLNMQYHICIDAALDNSRAMRLVILVSFVFHHVLCVAAAVQAIPDVHSFNVLQTKGRTLGSKDLLISSLGALLFLMVRIISRKGVFAVQDKTQRLWCVSYRCTVKIVPVSDVAASSASLHEKKLSSPRVKSKRMTYVPRETIYDGHVMLSGRWLSLEVWSTWQQRLLQASGFAGLSLNGVLFLWLNYMAKEQLSAREHVFSVVVATLMIFFTCCFCFTCFAHHHLKLLRRVFFSFDFVFLSFQMVALHLSACDIFFWDIRAINVLLAVLWMHWILTIDAVTPVVRRKLGLYLHHTLPLMIILIGVHLTVVCELARGTYWRVRDHKLFSFRVFGRGMDMMVIPFFYTRIQTVLLWECRVVAKIPQAGDGSDLVMIRGAVAFEPRANSQTAKRVVSPCATNHPSRDARPE